MIIMLILLIMMMITMMMTMITMMMTMTMLNLKESKQGDGCCEAER